ncbi:MAG: CDP-alcohol phosphatidyltransferase family protein [Myxococcota bacterium]|jgi:CDP-diacylglycerol---glycerol-3-phosphate 3-phosphatidyltransferase
MIRQLPNAITASRGALGPVVMYVVVVLHHDLLAFWLFLFAICTDLVDGWVARRLNATSRAALFLDPLADKLLTDFAWAALAWVGHAPVSLAVLMIVRDLAIGVAWAMARSRAGAWSPRPLGQIAVAFEGTGLCVLLFHGPWLGIHWPSVGTFLGWLSLGLSLVALSEYSRPSPSGPREGAEAPP